MARGRLRYAVKAYIVTMPGWKRDVRCCLDALIVSTVLGVGKAVRWNSPISAWWVGAWGARMECLEACLIGAVWWEDAATEKMCSSTISLR